MSQLDPQRTTGLNYYPDSNDDMDQLPSFEIIQGGGRPEQIYRRTDDSPATTGREIREVERKSDLRADCQKYLQMILNDVGKDDGERQPMNIVVIGKFYIFYCYHKGSLMLSKRTA